MKRHVTEAEVALYVSGDLDLLGRVRVRLHMRGCERCRRAMEAYRADRAQLRGLADAMPEGIDWNRLAQEITANIRVGLAAGECVAPRARKSAAPAWRPAAVAAGFAVLLAGGWWLNMPPSQTQALGHAMHAIWNAGHRFPAGPGVERGLVVEASPAGIELRENGSSLGVSQGAEPPIAVSLNVQGSASARYVDADTGQVTITSVYVQ